MASTGDAEHDSTPFMDDAELRDFANRHGVPPEVLLALPGPVVRGDCEAATWVYLKAHGLSEANVGRPSQIDAFKLEAGIRRRVLSARREIGIGDAGVTRPDDPDFERSERIDAEFISEWEALFGLDPAFLKKQPFPGWEGKRPDSGMETPDDLRRYLEVQLAYLRRFGECRIGEELLAVNAAAAALRNAILVFDEHLGEPEWDRLRPDPWPADPKNQHEAERALSDLIFRLRPTRPTAKPPLGEDAQSVKRDSAGEAAAADAKPAGATLLQPIKRPSERAFKAWRLRDLTGINNQVEIACKLIEQGTPASQGQVSRWLKEVEGYLKVGNILPGLPATLTEEPPSIDPKIIDMGKRLDGRTPRQRRRRDLNADDK